MDRDFNANAAVLTLEPSADDSREGPSLPHDLWLEGGLAALDADCRVVSLSDSLANWLGTASPSACGQPLGQLLEARLPQWQPPCDELWAEKNPFLQIHLRAGPAEARQWFRLEAVRNVAGWLVTLNSVLPPHAELAESGGNEYLNSEPERRQVFVRLLRAEARLENLVNRWPGVIFSQRADFSFDYVSPGIEELTGVPASAWRDQPQRFWEIVYETDVEELRRQCQRAISQQDRVTTSYRIRHAHTGRIAYILEHRRAIRSGDLLLGYEGIWLDITRQTIAEKRLSAAAWKETLGTLTLGLAHDFNNIISGILALSESYLAQMEADHPFADGLRLIKRNSLQASQLVHRIVNLHRSKVGEFGYFDLNQVMHELVELVEKILPRRVTIATDFASSVLPLYLDPVEFRQVIVNLALNAADAMPERGQLLFRTRLEESPTPPPHLQGELPPPPCPCLSVQDTGCGIAARHLPLLFDPFFTTKPVNKGSGLGLYNARLFVERHQGAISVESRQGVGTTFQLWLPQADFSEAERWHRMRHGHRRSILLVAEPSPLSRATAEFLRAHEYYVVPAATAERARDLLASEENSFQALLRLTSPLDMGVGALLTQVRAHHAGVKFIVWIVGGDGDELEAQVREGAHLVLAHDMAEEEILRRLDALWTSDYGHKFG